MNSCQLLTFSSRPTRFSYHHGFLLFSLNITAALQVNFFTLLDFCYLALKTTSNTVVLVLNTLGLITSFFKRFSCLCASSLIRLLTSSELRHSANICLARTRFSFLSSDIICFKSMKSAVSIVFLLGVSFVFIYTDRSGTSASLFSRACLSPFRLDFV